MLRLALLALFGAFAAGLDEEYQAWADKAFDVNDEEAIQKGKVMGCMLCNLLMKTVQKSHSLNLQKPRDERYTEEDTTELLLDTCGDLAGPLANRMKGYKKDSEMICKRVVRENVGDMLDALSLGETVQDFCKEQGLCDMGGAQIDLLMKMIADFSAEEAKKEAATKEQEAQSRYEEL